MEYNKPYESIDALTQILKDRGLTIADEEYAKEILSTVGYYRLSGYGLQFRHQNLPRVYGNFIPGTTFEDLVNIYEFDRKLRLLIIDAIERIEVSFRSHFNTAMAKKHGVHWFIDSKHFNPKLGSDGTPLFDHNAFLADTKEHKQTAFVKHYFQKYTSPDYPPCWMVAETQSLGVWSRAFGMLMVPADVKEVCDAFRLSFPEMKSWIQSITDLRNRCAHHSRVWDTRYANAPSKKGNLRGIVSDNQTLFAVMAVLIYLLWSVNPKTTVVTRLVQLITMHSVDIRKMGFPSNWVELLEKLRHLHEHGKNEKLN